MTEAVSSTNINNPLNTDNQYSFLNRGANGLYYEALNGSVFNNLGLGMGLPNMTGLNGMGMGMIGMPGMSGMGMGMYGNSEYMDNYIQNMERMQNSQMDMRERMMNRQMDLNERMTMRQIDMSERMADKRTQMTFHERGNNYVLQAHSESLQQQIARLAAYIQCNDMRSACDLYRQIYKTIDTSIGAELNNNSDRFDFNRGGSHATYIKNTIQNYYTQITGGRNLCTDIAQNGDSSCWSMIKSWFGGKQPSAKEAISIMTGDAQQYEWYEKLFRRFTKTDSGHKAGLVQTTSY